MPQPRLENPRAEARRDRDPQGREASRRAKNPLIICGGGAQGASEEVTAALRHAAGAGALLIAAAGGVLDSRDPFSVTLPLGHELWRRGRRQCSASAPHADPNSGNGALDKRLKVIRIDADAEEARPASQARRRR